MNNVMSMFFGFKNDYDEASNIICAIALISTSPVMPGVGGKVGSRDRESKTTPSTEVIVLYFLMLS